MEVHTPGGAEELVDQALDGFVTGLDLLIEVVEAGELARYANLIRFAQVLERARNRVSLIDHQIVIEAEARRLADELAQPNTARVLVSALRISAGEAYRRVRAAAAVGPRRSATGESMDPQRPALAAAQRSGAVSSEQVHIIERALAGIDRPGFDPAEIAAGEEFLTDQAAMFEPKMLSQVAERVVAAIDPDGSVPKDRLSRDRRHFSLRTTRDGAYVGGFRLTGAAGAKLSAVLRPLAKPRVTIVPSADQDGGAAGADPAAARHPLVACTDDRTYEQRMHDALEDACDRLLRSGELPDTGGTPATVIITVAAEDLVDRLGYGVTSDGSLMSAEQVLELAAEAEIIPTVMNHSGAVLSQGRARRIATEAQTWALIARDGGCSFPACDRPPELCERHHVVSWIDGGLTNLENLTLLCRYHHHQFAGRGWSCAINSDGLPEWAPPTWIDQQRRALVNPRIKLAQLGRRSSGDRVRRSRDAERVAAGP